MSAKECAHHHNHHRRKLLRHITAATVALTLLILFIVLLVYLILRPAKPHFTLQDVTVYAFNYTASPSLLTTTIQITLLTRNPNDRIGIYYDRLDVFVSYRNQQITIPTLLPSTYQGHKDVIVWSPFVYGNNVPVSPYVAEAINEDQVTGTVMVNVRVDGRVRWKVGTFISGKYHLNVNCPAYINNNNNHGNYGNNINGNVMVVGGGGMKYQLSMDCHVDV